MFDFNWSVNARRVTDGLSNTIAVGEAAHGPRWICQPSQVPLQRPVASLEYGHDAVDVRRQQTHGHGGARRLRHEQSPGKLQGLLATMDCLGTLVYYIDHLR